MTADRIWLAGWGQTIASWDGQGWRHATVEHASEQPPPGVFHCFGVSPAGEVLASREGTLFAGDEDAVREVHLATAAGTSPSSSVEFCQASGAFSVRDATCFGRAFSGRASGCSSAGGQARTRPL